MSRTLQFKRYGTTQLEGIRGANGEIIIDNTTKTITVHDGVTYGGHRLATEAYADANGGGGGGTTLPPNAAGVLRNNGTGTLSWSVINTNTSNLVNGVHTVSLNTNGILIFPQGSSLGQIANANTFGFTTKLNSDFLIQTSNYNPSASPAINIASTWSFGANGIMTLPLGGDIYDSNGGSVLGGSLTVITPENYQVPGVTTLAFAGAGVSVDRIDDVTTVTIVGDGDNSYTPSDTDNWNEPAVNTIQAALDELAARVTALQNYEIDGGNAYTPPQGETIIDGNGA